MQRDLVGVEVEAMGEEERRAVLTGDLGLIEPPRAGGCGQPPGGRGR